MATIVDLTLPLLDGGPSYPKDPQIRLRSFRKLPEDGCNVTEITMGTHQGTHLDAPFHFLPDGKTVDQIPLERFYGPAVLVDLAPGGELPAKTPITPDMLQPFASLFREGHRVICRTGWYHHFGQAEYFTDLPSLTAEAARWIAARRISLLGLDMPTPSKIAGRECHEVLLGPGSEIILVEGLTNLHGLPKEFIFSGFPLNLPGRDGSPIRAVAIIE